MSIRSSKIKNIVNGINLYYFNAGWWGKQNEGKMLLQNLGLSEEKIPFNVKQYIKNESISFVDCLGAKISICFKKYDTHFEFNCIFNNKKRTVRLYREWTEETFDAIIQFESYSIGECTRQIISGKSVI